MSIENAQSYKNKYGPNSHFANCISHFSKQNSSDFKKNSEYKISDEYKKYRFTVQLSESEKSEKSQKSQKAIKYIAISIPCNNIDNVILKLLCLNSAIDNATYRPKIWFIITDSDNYDINHRLYYNVTACSYIKNLIIKYTMPLKENNLNTYNLKKQRLINWTKIPYPISQNNTIPISLSDIDKLFHYFEKDILYWPTENCRMLVPKQNRGDIIIPIQPTFDYKIISSKCIVDKLFRSDHAKLLEPHISPFIINVKSLSHNFAATS